MRRTRNQRRRRRPLAAESLEPRRLLASLWQNEFNPFDVNDDGFVTPVDALININRINAVGSGPLPQDGSATPPPFHDVNGDGELTPLDVLLLINELNLGERGTILAAAEGDRFVTEASRTVTLGQESGTRRLSFTLGFSIDTSDGNGVLEDAVAIYLANPADRSDTLLSTNGPGGPFLAIVNGRPRHLPGSVAFNGSEVEVDLTHITHLDKADLVFQLINTDGDQNTRMAASQFTNVADPEGTPGELPLPGAEAGTPGPSLDLDAFQPTGSVVAEFEELLFDPSTGRFEAHLRLHNRGDATGRRHVVLFQDLPGGVSLLNASGTTGGGVPYVSFADAIGPGGLARDGRSEPLHVVLENVAQRNIVLSLDVLTAGANQAPVLEEPQPQSMYPGEVLELQLEASDVDGDPLTFRYEIDGGLPDHTLDGHGLLRFAPTPGQEGHYAFTAIVSDGAAEARVPVALEVAVDPAATTRVSGWVLDTLGEPLVNVPVEIGDLVSATDDQGRFLLESAGALPSDTLFVRGELANGNGTFPFIAEKLNLVLGRDPIEGAHNVISRPIYLPAIDTENARTIDPDSDVTVSVRLREDEAPAEVFVAKGSLLDTQGNPYTGKLSITEVPADLTPAALPPNAAPATVVTIQPGEMQFTTPAPLTMPNRAGNEPGELLDLWSINPQTGQFDKVGIMKVTDDGKSIETISGGIRNSSWHFPEPPEPDPQYNNPDENPANPDSGCPEECQATTGAGEWTSQVDFHSGALREWHSTVPYHSLGQRRDVTLVYDSLRADPRPIVHFGMRNVRDRGVDQYMVARLAIHRGNFQYHVPGYGNPYLPLGSDLDGIPVQVDRGSHIWKVEGEGIVTAGLQVDLSSQPSGIYKYSIRRGLSFLFQSQFVDRFVNGERERVLGAYGLTGGTVRGIGRLAHVNERGSPFGAGWSVVGLARIVENPGGRVLLIQGGGAELIFEPPVGEGQPFESPPGDFTELVKLDSGTYRRTFKNGTVHEFSERHLLKTARDRNGNTTSYTYDAEDRLLLIRDPVDRITQFTYGADGKLETILDPAGRRTEFHHDSQGNLTRITDPDPDQDGPLAAPQRHFEYDDQHHLVAETDARGFREQSFYDFTGRAVRAIRKDGSEVEIQPVQTAGIRPLHATVPSRTLRQKSVDENQQPVIIEHHNVITHDSVAEAPVARAAGSDVRAHYVDGNGRLVTTVLNGAGQVVGSFDSLGRLPITGRNEQNQVETYTDSRGNTTHFSYDERGNLTSVRDPLSQPAGSSSPDLFLNPAYTTGTHTRVIESADVNNDGNLDWIVPSQENEGGVAVFLGTVTGDFEPPLRSEGGTNINDLAIADLDADGVVDLVVPDAFTPGIVFLRGNGDGTFSQAAVLPTPARVSHIEVADLSGNGLPDIIFNQRKLSVIPNLGDGQFGDIFDIQVAAGTPQPVRFLAEDIDGNDIPDLLVRFSASGSEVLQALYLERDGTVADSKPVSYAPARAPEDLLLADLDDDGSRDLLLSGTSGTLSVLPGREDGTFGTRTDYRLPENGLYTTRVADVDGDEDLDVLVLFRSGSFYILSNDGSSTFDDPQQSKIDASSAFDLAVGDWNLDGRVDLGVLRRSSLILPIFGNGDGSFVQGPSYESGGASDFEVADLDGDGDMEIISASQPGQGLTVLYAEADRTYPVADVYPMENARRVLSADIDGDGLDDLMTTAFASTPLIRFNLGDGFGPAETLLDGRINDVAVGDIDGDGDPDLVAADFDDQIRIIRLEGDSREESEIGLENGSGPRAITLLDLEGDGDLDFVVAETNLNRLSVYTNDGSGSFSLHTKRDTIAFPNYLASGEINGDAFADIVALSTFGGNTVAVYLGDAAGTFDVRTDIELERPPYQARLGNVTDDGDVDLVVSLQQSELLTFRGNGDGTFQDAAISPIDNVATTFQLYDHSGDGRLDVVASDRDFVSFLPTRDDGTIDLSSVRKLVSPLENGLVFSSVLVRDVTQDGKADVLTALFDGKDSRVVVFEAGEDGRFPAPTVFRSSTRPHQVEVADLNGDGSLDAVTTHDGFGGDEGIAFMPGDGAGNFGPATIYPGGRIEYLELADLDDDGVLDVIAGDIRNDEILFYKGVGDGAFQDPRRTAVNRRIRDLLVVDMNEDGALDVITVDGRGTASILFNDGDGALGQTVLVGLDGGRSGLDAGDLDGDGDTDLVYPYQGGALEGAPARWVENLGAAGFASPRDIDGQPIPNSASGIQQVSVEDFNSDGILDVLVGRIDDAILVIPGLGNGLFAHGRLYSGGHLPQIFKSADLNDDGIRDLVVAGVSTIRPRINLPFTPSSGGEAEALPGERRFEYDATFNQLIRFTDELGHQRLFDVDPANGNTRAITQVIGLRDNESGETDDLVTRMSFSTQGLGQSIVDPLGRETQFVYDPVGMVTSIVSATGTADEATSGFEYDAAGHLTAFIDPNSARTEFKYDGLGRVTLIRGPDPDGTGPLESPVTQYEYDAAGNLTRVTDPRGNSKQRQYDAMGRLARIVTANGEEIEFRYDLAGNLLEVVNALEGVTANRYDARNRLIERTNPNGDSVIFTYDVDDNLVSIRDAVGNVTRMVYDARNQLLREVNAVGESRQYEYDPAGNVTARVDGTGRKVVFEYDERNLPVRESWSGDQQVIEYTYDAVGNLLSATDRFSSVTFQYDALNRVTEVDNLGTPDAPHVQLQYRYDAAGNRLGITEVINGEERAVTSYEYDAANRLSRTAQSGPGVAGKAVEFGYTVAGQRNRLDRYSDIAGTQLVASTAVEYDELDRISEITHADGQQEVLASYAMEFDSLFRVERVTDRFGSTDFSYDDVGQLLTATRDDETPPAESYTYDAAGNRISSHLHPTPEVVGPANRLSVVDGAVYTYDTAGNLARREDPSSGTSREFEYDYRQRLVAVVDRDASGTEIQRVEFVYDALNRRIAKHVNAAGSSEATHYLYDGSDVILEFQDADGTSGPGEATLSARYLHGPAVDQVLAADDASGDTSWYLVDHVGSVRDVVDSNGDTVNHLDYDAYGNLLSQSNPDASPRYRFTGREWDQEIGLYYYRARYYDPRSARFISEDPLRFGTTDTNFYRYAANAPTSLRDPSGKIPVQTILEIADDAGVPLVGDVETCYADTCLDVDGEFSMESEEEFSAAALNEEFQATAYPDLPGSFNPNDQEYDPVSNLLNGPSAPTCSGAYFQTAVNPGDIDASIPEALPDYQLDEPTLEYEYDPVGSEQTPDLAPLGDFTLVFTIF